jgi:hypothetical protein
MQHVDDKNATGKTGREPGQTRGQVLRKALVGGGTLAAGAALAPAAAQATPGDYVEKTSSQPAGSFQAVFTRTVPNRPAGSRLGVYTGAGEFNSTIDPFIGMGYYAPSGEYSSAWQVEGDWDATPGGGPHITEHYWQIIKPDGQSRRPFYQQYDRTMGRAGATWIVIGNGQSDTGAQPGGFFVDWDVDQAQLGVGCFAVIPNRIRLYAVTDGGVSARETRLSLYSAPNKGSAISLTYNGADAEGTFHPSFVLFTSGPKWSEIYVASQRMAWINERLDDKPGLQLFTGIKLGDNGNTRCALWGATGTPAGVMGRDGDWSISDNGSLYFKQAGSWVKKV